MMVVLFHIHPRPEIDRGEYERTSERMIELVSQIPGFVSIEGFGGEDGSELALVRFESEEAIARWREQPEHAQTRQRGREEFFASYDITVAEETRRYNWSVQDGVGMPSLGL